MLLRGPIPQRWVSERLVLVVLVALSILAVACGAEQMPTPTRPVAMPESTIRIDEPSAELGAGLVLEYGCNTCHSTDGTALVGPTWQGLYGTQEDLEDGTSVRVNDEYITESIQDPNAQVVKGFTAGLMPPTLGVQDDEIPHIIEYIKSLK